MIQKAQILPGFEMWWRLNRPDFFLPFLDNEEVYYHGVSENTKSGEKMVRVSKNKKFISKIPEKYIQLIEEQKSIDMDLLFR